MNYEKAYKDALERMKSWARGEHPECFTEAQKAAEFIFPELAESEDERIRNQIINFIEEYGNPIHCEWQKDCIAWLEKQGKKHSSIRWYDVSLIPQEMEELLVEWNSEDATWHEIAFYHADTKTFWDGERQVVNVTRWCYIDDIIEQLPKPKWSDDDEHHWMMCVECVEECATQEREDFSKTIDWLKSIKQRMGGEK